MSPPPLPGAAPANRPGVRLRWWGWWAGSPGGASMRPLRLRAERHRPPSPRGGCDRTRPTASLENRAPMRPGERPRTLLSGGSLHPASTAGSGTVRSAAREPAPSRPKASTGWPPGRPPRSRARRHSPGPGGGGHRSKHIPRPPDRSARPLGRSAETTRSVPRSPAAPRFDRVMDAITAPGPERNQPVPVRPPGSRQGPAPPPRTVRARAAHPRSAPSGQPTSRSGSRRGSIPLPAAETHQHHTAAKRLPVFTPALMTPRPLGAHASPFLAARPSSGLLRRSTSGWPTPGRRPARAATGAGSSCRGQAGRTRRRSR